MKKFFSSIKNWFANHLPTKRRLIQLYTALLYNCNLKGYIKGEISTSNSKTVCVPGLNCYSCPGAVGACPLGSLQNAFHQSGTRTGYYIIGIIGLFGLMFARTICGFLCPAGLGQELLHKVPTPKIKKSKVTRALSYLKYVLLVVLVLAVPLLYGLQGIAVPGFCKYICPAGTFGGGLGLLLNPRNWSGSRGLLNMLGAIFTWKFALLCAIIVFCVVMYRPFCRFLCPLGAIYGFFNRIAFLGVKVDKIKCVDCGLCVQTCEMDIRHVGDHECINCGKCISVCPTKAISWKGSEIFVHKNEIEDERENGEELPPTAPVDAVEIDTGTPLMQKARLAAVAALDTGAAGATTSAEVSAETISASAEVSEEAAADFTVQTSPENEAALPESPKSGKKKKKSAAFWVELTAWIAAIAVLISAIVYFNFIEKTDETAEYEIGQVCPDFTLKKYGANSNGTYTLLQDEFTLSEELGSVVVINFWATWCGPCVAELPYFNQVANEYPDVKIVAIHGSSTENVGRFIVQAKDTKESWRDYKVTFLQDDIEGNKCLTYALLGGNGAWPMTLIADKEGKINFVRQGSMTYDVLKQEVEKALNKEAQAH